MSTSFASYESLVHLMNCNYDPNLPVYYSDGHLNIVVNILQLMLNDFECVVTSVPMQEPLVEFGRTVYVSLPLVAQLVNMNVDLPKERVTITRNFNIFQGMRASTRPVKNSIQKCFENYGRGDDDDTDADTSNSNVSKSQFSTIEMTRIVQILRLVMMCAHFNQHHKRKHTTPYQRHDDFDELELAYVTREKQKKTKSNISIPSSTLYARQQCAAAVGANFGSGLLAAIKKEKLTDDESRKKRARRY